MATAAPSSGSVPNRGPSLMALMWVCTVVSSITIVLRFVFRARKAIIGWDDLFMLVALLCFYGWTISLTLLCLKGGEKHIKDVMPLGPDVIAEVQLLNWTAQVFGIIGVAAGKVSVSALILAIMQNTHRVWQKVYLWVFCMVLVCMVCISCSVLTFAQCRPAAALWDTRIKGHCIKPSIMADFGTFTGAYNTFVDASLALIPSTIFWSLKIGFQEKATLCIVFALNILTAICSGIKTSYLSQLANRSDFTWATYDIFAWVTAEFFLITVCGSIPTLKPILNFFRGRHGSRYWRSSYTRHTGDSMPVSDEVQLHSFRRDGVKSQATVSNSETATRKSDGDADIRVEKSYRVRIEKNDSQQELNREESG